MKIYITGGSVLASAFVAGVAMLSIGCGSSGTNGTGGVSGGTGGRGGTSGATGGSSGTGGAGGAVMHVVNYSFDTGVQGWALNNYPDTSSVNLAAPVVADAGTDAAADGGTAVVAPTLLPDSVVGNPAPGSVKVTVTFTAYGQYVDPVVNITPAANLMGKVLHSKLQLTSGMFSGGAQLHINAGGSYAKAPIVGILPATWVTTNLDLATVVPDTNPAMYDPAMVTQIGIQIFSGTAPVAGAPYPNAGMEVVFNIDTVTD